MPLTRPAVRRASALASHLFVRRSAGLLACCLSLAAPAALAHEGHGLSGPHWHATDVWGFVALAAVVALAVWISQNKR